MADYILALPPRSGGTTISLALGIHLGKVLYLNNRYANIEQACRNLEKLDLDPNFKGVLIMGQNRIEEIRQYYLKMPIYSQILTPADAIAFGMLENKHPYYLLLEWAKNSSITLTVPQIAWRDLSPDQYDVLIIDEDRTLDTFYPEDVELIKITISKFQFSIEIPILGLLDFIPNKIKKEYPEFLDWLNELAELKQNNNFWDYYNEAVQNGSSEPIIDALESLMEDIPEPPFTSWALDEKIRTAEELLRKGWKEEEYDVIRFFVASLFYLGYYLERHRKPPNGKIIYLVADRVLLFKDWLNGFKHIIIRGNDRGKAEAFFNALGRTKVGIIEDQNFRYARNFIVVHSDIFEVGKLLDSQNVPFLVFAGTKEIAEKVLQKFREIGIHNIELVDNLTPYEYIKECYMTGRSLVFYANSTISRGVDLPFYDVVLVYHFGFATPFEEITNPDLATETLINELEQSILRISPIPFYREESPKLVIFHSNIPKLRYLADRIFGVVEPSKLKTIIPFLSKVEKKEFKESLGKYLGFKETKISGRLYLLISPKIKSLNIGEILFYSVLMSQNPKIFKRVFLLGIRPEDLELWFRHIEGFEFRKWKELREDLRKVEKKKEKIEWFISFLKELDAFDEVGSGVNLRTGRHYRILKVKKFDKLKEGALLLL